MKKLLSIALALVMVIGMAPMSLFAASSTEVIEDYLWSAYNAAGVGVITTTGDLDGYPATNLNNGGVGASWILDTDVSPSDEAYIDIDLGKEISLRAMRVALAMEGDTPAYTPVTINYSYRSDSASEWETFGTVDVSGATTQIAGEYILDKGVKAQYVRLTFPDGDTGSGLSLNEIWALDDSERVVPDHHWPTISLSSGNKNGATVDAANWAVTRWTDSANTIKIDFADVGTGNTSSVTIDGEPYTSGSDYQITESGDIEVVVRTERANWFDKVQKFTISVGDAYEAPVATDLEVIEEYLWTTVDYNVAIGKAVTSNATYDDTKYPVSCLTDNGKNGFWVMTEPPAGEQAYVEVNLGAEKTVRAMRVALRMNGSTPVCIPNSIEYSYLNADGEWVSMGKVVTQGATTQMAGALVLPEDVQTQKIRLTFPDGWGSAGVGLSEIYVLDPTTRTLPDTRLPITTLLAGSMNGAPVDSENWVVKHWEAGVEDTIAVTAQPWEEGTTATIKINGEDYVSGSDYKITEPKDFEVIIRTVRDNWFDKIQKFTIRVREDDAYLTVDMPQGTTNLAQGKTVTASSEYNQNYHAQLLTDGSLNGRWVPTGDPNQMWAYVDLGSVAIVGAMRTALGLDGDMYQWVPNSIKFEYSTSLSGEWMELDTVETAFENREVCVGTPYRWVGLLLDGFVEARYIRVSFPDGCGNSGISLSELEVYGVELEKLEAPEAVVSLATGSTNGAVVDSSNWSVKRWVEDTANTIKVNVEQPDSNAFSTVTINGENYESGSDYTITSAGDLSVVVKTTKEGYADKVQEFKITVGGSYVVPEVTDAEEIEEYLWTTADYNVASGRKVTSNASYSETNYPASCLTNGGIGGFWVMSNPPAGEQAYVEVDFGQIRTVRAMRVALRNDGTKPVCKPNTIEYSYLNEYGEFVSMGKVATKDATTIIAGALVLDDDIRTQKVRLTFPDGDTGSGVGLAEIYILDPTTRALPDDRLPRITFSSGNENGANVDPENWVVNTWEQGVRDRVKIELTDTENGTTTTVTINGEEYIPGSDYIITKSGDLNVVIRTVRANYFDKVQKFTIKIGEEYSSEAISAPAVMLKSGDINGAIVDSDNWAVKRWIANIANTIKLVVIDYNGTKSTVTINGENYNIGSDYKITKSGDLAVVVTTTKDGYNPIVKQYTVTVGDGGIPTLNIAKNKAVTSVETYTNTSNPEFYEADLLVDGDTSNGWMPATSKGAWAYVDLGNKSTINSIQAKLLVKNNVFVNTPKSITYQYSNDLYGEWITIDKVDVAYTSGNAYVSGAENVTLTLDETVEARYVRMLFEDGASTSGGLQIAEFEIYGSTTTNDNIAYNKPGVLLSQVVHKDYKPWDILPPSNNNVAENATDGNSDTVAIAANSYAWTYQLDLMQVYDAVNKIEIDFGTDSVDQTPLEFEIKCSEDGVNWDTIKIQRFKSIAQKESKFQIKFYPTSMRYIRVTDLLTEEYNVSGNRIQMGIAEIRAYSLNADSAYDFETSIANGQTNVSVIGKVTFESNKKLPSDTVVLYRNSQGVNVTIERTFTQDKMSVTVKPTVQLNKGEKYYVTLSSESENFSKTVWFTTQTEIPEFVITTTSSSEYANDSDNAIYPAFVDNLHYQSWTLEGAKDYFQLKTSSASDDVKWEIIDGSLPTGLTLSGDGKISGMPQAEGTFNFTVKAIDDFGAQAIKSLDMIAKPYRAKWHNEARFGMMTQWGPFNYPSVTLESHQDGSNTIAHWEQRASGFNPTAWAAEMKSMGAEYFNFTVMGGDTIRLWPSTTPTKYELKTQRNFAKEIIDACHAQGIKFIAYLPAGGGWNEIRDVSTIDGTASTLHYGIISELIDMGIDGLWIDSNGSIGLTRYFDWDKIVPMIRTKNPDIIIGSNPVGTQFGYATNYPYVDYTIYEGHYLTDVSARAIGKWSTSTKAMSAEMTALHQAQWAMGSGEESVAGTMNSSSHIITNIQNNWKNGVTYTAAIAAPISGNTLMTSEARAQMTEVGKWVNANKATYAFDVNRGEKNVATVDASAKQSTAFSASTGAPMYSQVRKGDIHNYDSYAGVKFVAGQNPIIVTKLGRYVLEGNDQVHKLRLVQLGYKYDIVTILREVELDLSTATVEADGFAYVDIAPIKLAPGKMYYVMSCENTTDTFAVPDFDAIKANNRGQIAGAVWTDISGTRIMDYETLIHGYAWPYMVDRASVTDGGLTNFKAVVGNTKSTSNLIAGATATLTNNATGEIVASASDMFYAQNAIDDDSTTYTYATGGPWTLNIDMGEVKNNISRINVKFAHNSNYSPKAYTLMTSIDGINYTTRKTSDSSSGNISAYFWFNTFDARYVKFVVRANSDSGMATLIQDVQVYSDTSDANAPSQVELSKGSQNPVIELVNVAMPSAGMTDTTGKVTQWQKGTADTIKFNVTDSSSTTSTITINGQPYSSGEDYKLTKAGNLSVIVTTTQTNKNPVTRTFDIEVSEPIIPEPVEIGSEVYTIADGFIRKIEVGTTVNELLENVTPAGGDIKVYKTATAATAMRGTVAVGTGNVVKLFDADGNVVDSLTVVILGDVSGDGKINATDLISLVAYIGGSREYTEAQTIAANLQQPARPTINAQDLAFLKGAMDGSKTIVQK